MLLPLAHAYELPPVVG